MFNQSITEKRVVMSLEFGYHEGEVTLAYGTLGNVVGIWNTDYERILEKPTGWYIASSDVSYRPQAGYLATNEGSKADGMLVDMRTEEVLDTCFEYSKGVPQVQLSPDGLYMLRSADEGLTIVDCHKRHVVNRLDETRCDSKTLAVSNETGNRHFFVARRYEMEIKVWELDLTRMDSPSNPTATIPLIMGKKPHCLAIHAYEEEVLLAAAGGGEDYGHIYVWNALNGERISRLDQDINLTHVQFHPFKSPLLLSGDYSGRLRCWNTREGRHQDIVDTSDGRPIHASAFSHDGSLLAYCHKEHIHFIRNPE